MQLPNCWEFVVLTLACLRAGHRAGDGAAGAPPPRAGLPRRAREAAAIAVPDRLRDFDHQALAAQLVAEVRPLQHVLVAGDEIAAAPSTSRVCAALGDAEGPAGRDATTRTAGTSRCSCSPAAPPACRS